MGSDTALPDPFLEHGLGCALREQELARPSVMHQDGIVCLMVGAHEGAIGADCGHLPQTRPTAQGQPAAPGRVRPAGSGLHAEDMEGALQPEWSVAVENHGVAAELEQGECVVGRHASEVAWQSNAGDGMQGESIVQVQHGRPKGPKGQPGPGPIGRNVPRSAGRAESCCGRGKGAQQLPGAGIMHTEVCLGCDRNSGPKVHAKLGAVLGVAVSMKLATRWPSRAWVGYSKPWSAWLSTTRRVLAGRKATL